MNVKWAIVIAGGAIAAVTAAWWLGRAPAALPAAYALGSLITFATYFLDKKAAQHNARRTPEATLHGLEMLGGWPGALVAQQLFRHKCSKLPYMVVFWLIVAGHVVGWVAYLGGWL